jgi:SAM-dependent methyltransferase
MDKKLDNWKNGKPEELKFWDTWLSSKGGFWKEHGYDWTEDFKTRMDPESILQDYVANEIIARYIRFPLILDVCAGPLTILNKKMDGERLNIFCIDALAMEYDEMLMRYEINPLIRTLYGEAENFKMDYFFDVIHCSNGLDHSYDPIAAIVNMITHLNTNGVIILKHFIREGARGNYGGLHQWNFFEKDGHFIISDSEGNEINVTMSMINYFRNTICRTYGKEIIVTIS